MTIVNVNVPKEYDEKITIMKAERKIKSKAEMINEIIKEYINRIEIEKINNS